MRPLKDRRDREEALREWEQVSDRQKQKETDRDRQKQTCFQNWLLCGGSCKEHIIDERAGDRERERERLRARLRDTCTGKETEIKHKGERETHREEETERYQAHLVEATNKPP